MSLRVWIPFTDGTAKNQGTSNLTFSVTDSSKTYSSDSGKLGKCFYNNDYYNQSGLISNENITLPVTQSWFCWAKFDSFGSSASLNGVITNHDYVNKKNMGITILYVSSSTGKLSCNTGTGSSRTYNTYTGNTTLNAGTWYHIGFTYDGSNIRFYVNGELDGITAYSGLSLGAAKVGVFRWDAMTENTYNMKGYINDVRIYDNVLTPSEIKELSKGLALHYTLGSASLLEATTNVASNDWYTYTSYWNNQSGSYGNFNLTQNNGQILAFSNGTIRSSMSSGLVWTLSGYLYRNGVPYKTYCTTPTTYSGFTINSWESRNDGYFRYTVTVNSVPGWLIHNTLLGDSNPQGTQLSIKGLLFELKDHATWFTPTSRTDGIVWDSSGYGRNGSIRNNIGICESPRYDIGINCSSNGKVLTPAFEMNSFGNSYSISWWALGSSASQQMMIGFTNGNRMNVMHTLCLNTGDSQSNPFYNPGTTTLITCPSTTDWHHYVLTGDGSTSKLYVDGVHYGTAKYYRAITGTQICINGWDTSNSYNFNGKYSDFRIYSTVLSLQDVKDLYSLGASIS